MAFRTGGAIQGLGMAGATGSAAMIYPAAAFVCDAGVRTSILRGPILARMAGCTIQAEHSRVECRVRMTTLTGSG